MYMNTVINIRTEKKMKITDYHRDIAARYYGRLIKRFGFDFVLARAYRLKNIIWSEKGLELMEGRVKNARDN